MAYEVALVVPSRVVKEVDVDATDGTFDCVELLVDQLKRVGLVVQRDQGASYDFIKVSFTLPLLASPLKNMLSMHFFLCILFSILFPLPIKQTKFCYGSFYLG